MSGDSSSAERNEAPTPKKRADARKKGQVPRSQEMGAAFALIAGAAFVTFGVAPLALGVTDLFVRSMLAVLQAPGSLGSGAAWLSGLGWRTLALLGPLLAVMGGTALAVGGVQGRGVVSLDPIKPKWSKLDPIRNAKRIWGMKAIVEFAKSLGKLAVIALAAWLAVGGSVGEILSLGARSPRALVETFVLLGARVLLFAGLAYLAVAALDYWWQIHRHEKELKMSREEVKRENKEQEGDPNVKARRRAMARSLTRRRMMLAVSEADVVVTNPTHVAVALKYDPERAGAPIVLAMGERKLAQRIKQLARESGVPTVENVPLARALLAAGTVGEPIPAEFYVAVAELLAFVYKTSRRGRAARRRTIGSRPGRPGTPDPELGGDR